MKIRRNFVKLTITMEKQEYFWELEANKKNQIKNFKKRNEASKANINEANFIAFNAPAH